MDFGKFKMPLTWAVVASAAGGLVAWGANSTKLETVQTEVKDLKVLISQHDRQLAKDSAMDEEILSRLRRIEDKLDRSKD
jgi:outer membrane murein-binding lipoprotein Lpp